MSEEVPAGVIVLYDGPVDTTPQETSRFMHVQTHYDENFMPTHTTLIEHIPGGTISFSNPHRYRGYRIYPSDYVPMAGTEISFSHEDYDGAEDANDNRAGYAASYEDAKAQIDELEDE